MGGNKMQGTEKKALLHTYSFVVDGVGQIVLKASSNIAGL
ncbi:hypothetical protein SAMN06265219_101438 [Gracilimonas mengyeensis]|uniref:Uncharacterized protein n=1 Tax=Gracilimonas mengyeensis TaxID=1302730 RepID=A0A521AYA6_9BACT|nr:hypothetical protein SAMN06265219_101438 [Gracilimonas mengyeensis]